MIHTDENITVTPAKAGVLGSGRTSWPWIPAYAGMTTQSGATPR